MCIVLLDIDMPELSGYDVAKILDDQYPEVPIIFVSAREELVYESFEYHPLYFVRKSHFKIEICHATAQSI